MLEFIVGLAVGIVGTINVLIILGKRRTNEDEE